jgi:hypothetical protein
MLDNKPCHFILIFDNGYFSNSVPSPSPTDRTHAKAAAGEEFWPAGIRIRLLSQGRGHFAREITQSVPLQG